MTYTKISFFIEYAKIYSVKQIQFYMLVLRSPAGKLRYCAELFFQFTKSLFYV